MKKSWDMDEILKGIVIVGGGVVAASVITGQLAKTDFGKKLLGQ